MFPERPNLPSGARVLVAMSGGVDSSVTAALLKEQGFEVVGVSMRLLDEGALGLSAASGCCGGRDLADARRVAERLGIGHYVLDFAQRFEEGVIRPFARAYAQALTPSPCIDCNRTVKFRDLLQVADEMGARALATGHYARIVAGAQGPELHRGADPAKDQSYFLFATTRAQLARLLFPLGDLTKDEVRAQAQRLGLAVAAKPDSQDICFAPEGDHWRLVGRLCPEALEPGEIVDQTGTVLGRHAGLARYTVGQRKGLGIGGGPPLYVVGLDAERNRVTVGPPGALARTDIDLVAMNWLGEGEAKTEGEAVAVKLRSTRPPMLARLVRRADGTAHLRLERPEMGVAPGQAGVVYRGERLLGGGWIAR
ncbi:MAG: tRNA 2-thiouridine(34) synthase MnmA [Rhodospirillales bacterium]|nr:tRNA 2-thiouridine(34) synthase MnmA [Rhodospirillales bacterium]